MVLHVLAERAGGAMAALVSASEQVSSLGFPPFCRWYLDPHTLERVDRVASKHALARTAIDPAFQPAIEHDIYDTGKQADRQTGADNANEQRSRLRQAIGRDV